MRYLEVGGRNMGSGNFLIFELSGPPRVDKVGGLTRFGGRDGSDGRAGRQEGEEGLDLHFWGFGRWLEGRLLTVAPGSTRVMPRRSIGLRRRGNGGSGCEERGDGWLPGEKNGGS